MPLPGRTIIAVIGAACPAAGALASLTGSRLP
jgi:hypothetical protein